jgi:hypothetical protein
MRARVALAALALVAVAACGGDDDDDVTSGAVAGDVTTTTTASTGAGGTSGTLELRPDESSTPTTAEDPTVTTVTVPTNDLAGPPGAGAPWFLRPDGTPAIVIEVLAEPGAEPDDDTIVHVSNVLIAASGKGANVGGGDAPSARASWSADDLRAAAGEADGVLKLLFVHGEYAESDTVLGIAVRADVAAVFVDRVRDSASPLVGSDAIEAAVTTHEIGHLLGLVDLHLDTGRGDPEHPGHSTNHRSVMYWAVESSLVTDLLTGGPPRDFDDADLADLAAIRAGQ